MRLHKDLVLREVGGEYMIVNPFSDTVDMTQVYSLNETAAQDASAVLMQLLQAGMIQPSSINW